MRPGDLEPERPDRNQAALFGAKKACDLTGALSKLRTSSVPARSSHHLLLTLPLVAVAFAVACKKEAAQGTADGRHAIAITVAAVGYHPAESLAKAGQSVRLVVTRTTDDGCGQELVVPSLNLKRELPLKQPVNI